MFLKCKSKVQYALTILELTFTIHDIFLNLRKGLKLFRGEFYLIAENIARYHHERWDGNGYPEGLSGTNIPLEARVVAVADVFDALTSKRVYKEAWTLEASFAEIERSGGSHLDPELVRLFIENKAEVTKISKL